VPTCCFVSFRLGLTDGVSIVADTWMRAFRDLGFEIVTVAGAGPVDRTVPGLDVHAAEPPVRDELEAALADADLVVVENLLTIPLNLAASRALVDLLRHRPAVLHHHDPPWQRDRFRDVTELPPDDPAWRHVTINRMTEAQMSERGVRATTIYNGFAIDPGRGDRELTRSRLGLERDDVLVVHPVRAIARKRIPDAIAFTESLGGTYWLSGVAEEGYDDQLRHDLASATCRVIHRTDIATVHLYQAADVVVFPSTWEGFGNPPVEAAFHRRPAAVGPYPVGRELMGLGLEWFDAARPDRVRAFLDRPDEAMLDRNLSVARTHFSTHDLTVRLCRLLDDAGWLP
jgi:mannosylglucosylglycerate synthase